MAAAAFRARFSSPQLVVLSIVIIFGFFCVYQLSQKNDTHPTSNLDASPYALAAAKGAVNNPAADSGGGTPVDISALGNDKQAFLKKLGVYVSRNDTHWLRKSCDPQRKLRPVSILTGIGNLTFYIYDNGYMDTSVSERALHGEMFERDEIERFLLISKDLPLIDLGANVGLVTLQAALQGREVVAVEPIPENAVRLCRSVVDFGHSSLVRVVNNAVSSSEGVVTMAMDTPRHVARFEISRSTGWGFGETKTFSILTDRLLEIPPFKKAALKIDVESHEGHVMAGARRLFQEVDLPLVWMEWDNVKKIQGTYGPLPILRFMKDHGFEPYELMTGKPLQGRDFMTEWPFTVLWVKQGVTIQW